MIIQASTLVAALCLAPLGVRAQTVVDIASCDDLPPAITTDTTLRLTSSEIACTTLTMVSVSSEAAVEVTSSEASTKLDNIRFDLSEKASMVFTVPQLDWTSVETEPDTSYSRPGGGAAMRIDTRSRVTFTEDVTFSACGLDEESSSGSDSAAAITNYGIMVFEGTATFKDTIEDGALYTNGNITFEGDALFENNKNNNFGFGNRNGAGLHIDSDGSVYFKGAASFIDNEVTETFQSGGRGAGLFSNSYGEDTLVFSGPVLFKGNSGLYGAMALFGEQTVIFESLVTFEDNVMAPKLSFDSSAGGGMMVTSYNKVEFQAGVTATGNSARRGGAFFFDDVVDVVVSGPVIITGNEAGYSGGAIWSRATTVTLPADADISDNTATFCPGILNEEGVITLGDDGMSYTGSSQDLCYLGSPPDSSMAEDVTEDFDCEAYVATAPDSDGYPYLILSTDDVKTWNLGTSVAGGFSCPQQTVVYVTGGSELTIASTAASSMFENVRFEVVGYTKLILDMADLTITGIYQSQLGGAVFVDTGSSMEVMEEITFLGNTVAYEEFGAWRERGGPAIYSAGDVKFYERAYFLGNGQYEADASGYEPSNQPGGAIFNSGTMEFMGKGTLMDNFNPNGGDGGAIANYGEVTFNLRGVFRNNSVGVAYTDDGEPYGGRGGALYNGGGGATVVFKRLAFFRNNVGALGGCALATRGSLADDDDDGTYVGDGNKVTFEYKAKFKDNACDGDYPTIYDDSVGDRSDAYKGGGALLAYGASVVEFMNTAVFKRNEATNGGAIVNSALMSFITEEKLFVADNVALASCPDILNNSDGIIEIGEKVYVGPDASICERP